MGTQIRFREHLELQIGLPWTIWTAIGTLGGPILALVALNFDRRGLILVPGETVLGAPGLHFKGPGAPCGSILSVLH